jgi:hypothetical protein
VSLVRPVPPPASRPTKEWAPRSGPCHPFAMSRVAYQSPDPAGRGQLSPRRYRPSGIYLSTTLLPSPTTATCTPRLTGIKAVAGIRTMLGSPGIWKSGCLQAGAEIGCERLRNLDVNPDPVQVSDLKQRLAYAAGIDQRADVRVACRDNAIEGCRDLLESRSWELTAIRCARCR